MCSYVHSLCGSVVDVILYNISRYACVHVLAVHNLRKFHVFSLNCLLVDLHAYRWIRCFVEHQWTVLATLTMLHSLGSSNMAQRMSDN